MTNESEESPRVPGENRQGAGIRRSKWEQESAGDLPLDEELLLESVSELQESKLEDKLNSQE